MTCVICPTCGSQCSLGGVGETRYFIPPKDENERIADLQRQLAEAKAEALEKFAYGWGPKDDIWSAEDIGKIALEEAAEYRKQATDIAAKVGRKE